MDNIISSISNLAPAKLDVTTLLATPSSTVKIEGRNTGSVAKLPVVIGKTLVQVYIDALVNLEEPAFEIKNVNHNLNLGRCEFLPIESNKSGKLIISGYIRENIEYTSAKAMEDGTVRMGNSRTTIDIPYKCFTKITLDSEPVLASDISAFNTEEQETAKIREATNYYYLGNQEELSFEMAEAGVRQVNVKQETEYLRVNNFEEEVFSTFSVNMAVDVVLLILQNQYVKIGSGGSSSSSGNSSSGGQSSSSSSGSSGKGNSSNSSSNSSNGNKNSSNNKKGDNKGKGSSISSLYSSWANPWKLMR